MCHFEDERHQAHAIFMMPLALTFLSAVWINFIITLAYFLPVSMTLLMFYDILQLMMDNWGVNSEFVAFIQEKNEL